MPDGKKTDAARNIEAILELERQHEQSLNPLQRAFHLVGWFVGTVYFAIFQTFGLLIWVLLNAGPGHLRVPFDLYPFPPLSEVLALEAVLLTSFVLVRQANLDRQSDRRNHIDLQINMLAEDEAAKAVRLLKRIAKRLGLEERDDVDPLAETSAETIAKHLQSKDV